MYFVASSAVALFLALTLAVGCTPAEAPQARTSVTKSDTFIRFERTGGIAGFHDVLVIGDEGRAVLSRKNGTLSYQIERRKLNAIVKSFRAASFSRLRVDYSPERPAPDAFRYSITYRGHTVIATSSTAPEKLRPVMAILQEEVNSRSVR